MVIQLNKHPLAFIVIVILVLLLAACNTNGRRLQVSRQSSLPGSEFYKQSAGMGWKERDSFALQQFYAGNIPSFLLSMKAVHVVSIDSASGKVHKATYYVTPDYYSVGNNDDWARVPITPMVADLIADSLNCFLPTRKMVDDIYKAATVKLEPVPMYAFRDSTPTMWQHHLIIEGQRRGRPGLIAGIKKDVVNSSRIRLSEKPNRVAIYGWHKMDGKAIQPLYTGHVNWYVDYSHGVRFVSRRIRVDGQWMDYKDVLNDPILKRLLCDEEDCNW